MLRPKDWKSVKRLYGRVNFTNQDALETILRTRGYDKLYGAESNTAVLLDAYPGLGIHSAAIHNVIKPHQHILMEPHLAYYKYLEQMSQELKEGESPILSKSDPFRWSTFTNLDETSTVQYKKDKLDYKSGISPYLLYAANLSMKQGEQLCAQYLNCIWNRSWLMSRGRVRLLLWVQPQVARKLFLPVGDPSRGRITVQAESCAEVVPLVACPEDLEHEKLVYKATPQDFTAPTSGKGLKTSVLLEVTPLEEPVPYLDSFEYVIKMLFILRSRPLEEAITTLGPGAAIDLIPRLPPQMRSKPAHDMTLQELYTLTKVFHEWPFKPQFLHDFFEETNAISHI